MNPTQIADLRCAAWRMRCMAMKMALNAGANGAHLGPGLSMMELAAVLFKAVMTVAPGKPERDRFILSKAHAVLAYYTALVECGILQEDELNTFEKNGSDLPGHPILCDRLGIEVPGGSLGMGLPFAVGSALAGKRSGENFRVFVILGDGECNEGSIWEAAMAAANYRLDNLYGIIDRNHLQYDGNTEEVMQLGKLADKWRAFGWNTQCVDGHDIDALLQVFETTSPRLGRPTMIIADTVKGKGVSFMENNPEWHHRQLSQSQYDKAMAELTEYGKKELGI